VSIHTVQNAGVTIHCHALDLALEPADLLRQIDGLARTMTPVHVLELN
jgi:5-methylcytosine-specific restriction enzyme subunit McrC